MKLLAVPDCHTLREPGAGEAATGQDWALGKPQGMAGPGCWRSCIQCWNPASEHSGSRKETSSSRVSLLASVHVPAGKEGPCEGPGSTVTEQAMKGE